MYMPRSAGLMSAAVRTPKCPNAISKAEHDNANAAANATTRRDADKAASSGTTTSQIAANDSIPPVVIATAVTSPARASDDSTWAPSYRPVRDRNHDSNKGAISHGK